VVLLEALLDDLSALRGLQPEILLHLGRSLRVLGRTSESDALLQELIASYPGTAAADAARSEMASGSH
jgi:TolA-binding protein